VSDRDRRWLTPPAVARILGVHPETVHRWIKKGALKAKYVAATGRYYVERAELTRFRDEPLDTPPESV
jgi:predicted site-specific integrase-resolvase